MLFLVKYLQKNTLLLVKYFRKTTMVLGILKVENHVVDNIKTTKGCREKLSGKVLLLGKCAGNLEMKNENVFGGDRGQKGRNLRSIMLPRNTKNVERMSFRCLVRPDRLKIC